MDSINEEQLEKTLTEMPQFERSAKADTVFYTKLAEFKFEKKKNPLLETKKSQFAEQIVESFSLLRRLVFVGGFTAMAVLIVATAIAYQPGVTRGHMLYGLKQIGEKIEISFAFSQLSKVDSYLRFSDRRLTEAENIVALHPSLAIFFKTAFAASDEISTDVDTNEQENLKLTFADMKQSIDSAAKIIEEKINRPEQIETALAKIEIATEKHVEKLTLMEKRGKQSVKTIVKNIADEEDARLANVIEALEETKIAMESKKEKPKIAIVAKPLPKEKEQAEPKKTRESIAAARLKEAVLLYEKLPTAQKTAFQEKVTKFEEAMTMEKFGKAEGLARALTKNIEYQNSAIMQKLSTAAKKFEPTLASPQRKKEEKKPQLPVKLPEPLPSAKEKLPVKPVQKPAEEPTKEPTKIPTIEPIIIEKYLDINDQIKSQKNSILLPEVQ